MAAVVIAFNLGGPTPRPWQNHELAELYRVVDLLGKAGLAVETDFGLSDEGDPWFVFCRADTGEPVVHFARIGCQYIAAGVDIGQTYCGKNFRDIIDQLMRQQPVAIPRPVSGGNLFLHPAAVLTAFVAAALLHSHHADAAESAGTAIHVVIGNGGDATHRGPRAGLPNSAAGDTSKPAPAAAPPIGIAASQPGIIPEPGISLASLMAMAMAAIAPLVDEENTRAMAPGPENDGNAASVAAASAIDLVPADGPAIERPHSQGGETPRLAAPGDGDLLHRQPPSVGQGDSPNPQAVQPLPAPQHNGGARPALAHPALELANHTGDPGTHPPVFHAPPNTWNGSSAESRGGHQFTLNDIDPLAIQALRLKRADAGPSAETLSAAETHAQATDNTGPGISGDTDGTVPTGSIGGTAGTGATTGPSGTDGANGGGHAGPANTVIDGSSATTIINTLSDFIFSGQHGLAGHFQPSSYLSFAVSAYSAINGDNVRLLVFTSKDLPFPIFPFVKGVLFVAEEQLVHDPGTVHPTNMVTIALPQGESMTLIGVVTTDSTHPLSAFA